MSLALSLEMPAGKTGGVALGLAQYLFMTGAATLAFDLDVFCLAVFVLVAMCESLNKMEDGVTKAIRQDTTIF